jgi:hypothetical protein
MIDYLKIHQYYLKDSLDQLSETQYKNLICSLSDKLKTVIKNY